MKYGNMRVWPVKKPKCPCVADAIVETSVIAEWRGNPPQLKRSKKVFHYRESDQAHFWHWDDQSDNLRDPTLDFT